MVSTARFRNMCYSATSSPSVPSDVAVNVSEDSPRPPVSRGALGLVRSEGWDPAQGSLCPSLGCPCCSTWASESPGVLQGLEEASTHKPEEKEARVCVPLVSPGMLVGFCDWLQGGRGGRRGREREEGETSGWTDRWQIYWVRDRQ